MSDSTVNQADSRSPRIYKILIMILPVGVVIGTIIFMFMYFYLEREDEKNHAVIVSHGLRVSDLEDMVGKFTDRIGQRNIESEQGRAGLRRAASMIEGRLGPQNVGYPVVKSEGKAAYGLLWKSLSVEILGEEKPDEVVFAAVSYAGAGEDADANIVSTLIMLASSMARENPARTIRFVFTPLNDSPEEQNQWLIERCLKPGESCVGILGIKTMPVMPSAGDAAWQADVRSAYDIAWWNTLKDEKTDSISLSSGTGSVWLTHPVFSTQTWVDSRGRRLDSTLSVAQDLRKWLVKAAR
ncbi:MAG: hypothetical protein P8P36_06345 [Akkermansiaceae bacterium]|nr:hypothetical protein [Akkermansiaceae bacterium]